MIVDFDVFDKPRRLQDGEAEACKRLWQTVLHIAVLDCKAGKSSAKYFFVSRAFKTIAMLLKLNVDEVQRRILPADFLARFNVPEQTMPTPVGTKRRGRPRKAVGMASQPVKPNYDNQTWHEREMLLAMDKEIAMLERLAKMPAKIAAQNMQRIAGGPNFEDNVMAYFERSSLEEMELACAHDAREDYLKGIRI